MLSKTSKFGVSPQGFRVLGPVRKRELPATCDNCGSGLTRNAVHATTASGTRVIVGFDCAATLQKAEVQNRMPQ